MSEQVQAALQALGYQDTPLASLEQDNAFFVLLPNTLIYQDTSGRREVKLSELSRIHSDDHGILRVDTASGTAIAASLVGYEPGEVQQFFAQVREGTLRHKQQQVTPLPSDSPSKTFAPKLSPKLSAPGDAASAPFPAAPRPSAPISVPRPAAPAPVPAPSVPAPEPRLQEAESTPFPVTAPAAPEPAIAEPLPVESSERPLPSREPASVAPSTSTLDAQAEAVAALSGRLKLLGGILGLAALAFAIILFMQHQGISAMWTLIAGGVGAVALMLLGDIAALLAAMARRL